jgi:hypothetical protein
MKSPGTQSEPPLREGRVWAREKWVKMKFLGYFEYRHDENSYKVTVIRTIKGKKANVVSA